MRKPSLRPVIVDCTFPVHFHLNSEMKSELQNLITKLLKAYIGEDLAISFRMSAPGPDDSGYLTCSVVIYAPEIHFGESREQLALDLAEQVNQCWPKINQPGITVLIARMVVDGFAPRRRLDTPVQATSTPDLGTLHNDPSGSAGTAALVAGNMLTSSA